MSQLTPLTKHTPHISIELSGQLIIPANDIRDFKSHAGLHYILFSYIIIKK